MPDLVLDYHRLKVPLDHPDLSVTTAKIADSAIATAKIADSAVTKAKLEYPTVDVSFAYLAAIDKVVFCSHWTYGYSVLTRNSFADKAVFGACQVNRYSLMMGRVVDKGNFYFSVYDPGVTTGDHYLAKYVAGAGTGLGSEAIDIDNSGRGLMISCSGSSIKSMRFELPAPRDPLSLPSPNYTIAVTDTSFASGYFGYRPLRETYAHGGSTPDAVYLKPPASEVPRALMIIEVEATGDGSPESPFRPLLSETLVDVSELRNAPDFLKIEKRKYDVLKARGFTEEEMKVLLGYVPQRQVDLDSVSWGSFEFSERSPTNIVVVTSDNPYEAGAINRQVEFAKKKGLKALRPPRDYDEAVSQYNELKRGFKHWLAGKDNYAYQTLGLEVFELFQSVDFYYGELIEHKAHCDQLKAVPRQEIERRLEELEERLKRIEVLHEERDKHLNKLREAVKRGW